MISIGASKQSEWVPPFEDDNGACAWCGGPVESIGILGRIEWFRCRHCGADTGYDATTKEETAASRGKEGK